MTTMDHAIQAKVRELGDLDLVILVCMIAKEHCILSTHHSRHELRDELDAICRSVFGLRPAILNCSPDTTIDDFGEGILADAVEDSPETVARVSSYGFSKASADLSPVKDSSGSHFGNNTLDTRRIADVIIAVDLERASEAVQIQALELIKTKRSFTRSAMHTAPKDLMILAVTSKPGALLTHHLNDLFCMSHTHTGEEDFAYSNGGLAEIDIATFAPEDIDEVRELAHGVHLTPELAAYLHNIVVFMRNSRYVAGGVTATATRQLRAIAKVLAPLHGLDYVPPSLVALAAHKIYPHRLKLATAQTERSLQWGSDPEAVRLLLSGITVEWVINDVLASVETPL